MIIIKKRFSHLSLQAIYDDASGTFGLAALPEKFSLALAKNLFWDNLLGIQ